MLSTTVSGMRHCTVYYGDSDYVCWHCHVLHDQMLYAAKQKQSAQFAAPFAITLMMAATAVWSATDCYAMVFTAICSKCIICVFKALGCSAETCHVLSPGMQISESGLT